MNYNINSLTQEFSLAIQRISFLTFTEQLFWFFFRTVIVQGVCSCFSLFNLQGALRSFAGFYCITSSSVCQELFSNPFELFVIRSSLRDFSLSSELI